jgi:hypothetical protein
LAVVDTLPPIFPCSAAIQRFDPGKPSSSDEAWLYNDFLVARD